MRLHIFSPQLTLGALLHLKLFVASPPAAVTVSSVRATLVSTHVLCPPAADIADIEVPVAHVAGTGPSPTVSDFDGTSKTLTTREEWTYRGIFAMPLCYPDGAAPSTLEGSDHYIRISHKLAIQVRYSTGSETSTKATTISIPVTVDSVRPLGLRLGARLTPHAYITSASRSRSLSVYPRIPRRRQRQKSATRRMGRYVRASSTSQNALRNVGTCWRQQGIRR